MPISRPLLIVLVVAVLALLGFYATQAARNSADSSGPAPAAEPTPDVSAGDAPPSVAKADPGARAAARRRARAKRAGMPPAVAKALAGRKTVVLFFRGSGSADDRATGRAVAALRGDRNTVVVADRIGRLGRYRAVVGELGISQAPAVVIVDRSRSARVVQGYIDPKTLAQDVADSR